MCCLGNDDTIAYGSSRVSSSSVFSNNGPAAARRLRHAEAATTSATHSARSATGSADRAASLPGGAQWQQHILTTM